MEDLTTTTISLSHIAYTLGIHGLLSPGFCLSNTQYHYIIRRSTADPVLVLPSRLHILRISISLIFRMVGCWCSLSMFSMLRARCTPKPRNHAVITFFRCVACVCVLFHTLLSFYSTALYANSKTFRREPSSGPPLFFLMEKQIFPNKDIFRKQ